MESINEKKQMMTPSTPPIFLRKKMGDPKNIHQKHDAFAEMSFRLQNMAGVILGMF